MEDEIFSSTLLGGGIIIMGIMLLGSFLMWEVEWLVIRVFAIGFIMFIVGGIIHTKERNARTNTKD